MSWDHCGGQRILKEQRKDVNEFFKEQRKDVNQFTTTRPKASWDHHGGQHFVLLVEPMFVLACLASLPGTPRRALDAAGLVLAWFGVFAMAMAMQVQADKG